MISRLNLIFFCKIVAILTVLTPGFLQADDQEPAVHPGSKQHLCLNDRSAIVPKIPGTLSASDIEKHRGYVVIVSSTGTSTVQIDFEVFVEVVETQLNRIADFFASLVVDIDSCHKKEIAVRPLSNPWTLNKGDSFVVISTFQVTSGKFTLTTNSESEEFDLSLGECNAMDEFLLAALQSSYPYLPENLVGKSVHLLTFEGPLKAPTVACMGPD